MKPRERDYKSAKQTHVAGSTLTFQNFVPRYGPRGGRNVIDGFDLVAEFPDVTQASTAVEGEEAYRVWKRIVVEQVGGLRRWNLRGDETRQALYVLEGADRVREHADIAVAANQNLTFSCYIPMAKRFVKRPVDFALPGDLLHQVQIECGDASEISVGGGTTTITSARYYVVAHTHEEFQVELKCEDEVKASVFANTEGLNLKVGGRLQGLVIFARGASGGASMSNFTDIRIDELLPVAAARDAELVRPFLRDRYNPSNLESTDGAAVRNDPSAAGRAVPVIWSDEDTSPFDGPIIDDVQVYTTNSVSSCIAISHTVKALSKEVASAVMSAYKLPAEAFRVKTVGKSKRGINMWDGREEELAFMPKAAALPRLGRRQAAA